MVNDWFGNWVIGTLGGLSALLVVAVVVPPTARNSGDLSSLKAQLSAGSSVFASFTLPPHRRAVTGGRERGVWRWNAEGVWVIQTDHLRLRFDGEALWEDGQHGLVEHEGPWVERVGSLQALLRSGFRGHRIRALEPGELPAYPWTPGVDLFVAKPPLDWPQDLRVVVGLVDDTLAELAVVDGRGQVVTYQGHRVHAAFERVAWGVPLGPDLAQTRRVPLAQLGARTVFQRLPPQVLRDLPFYERVQHHAMQPAPDASEGVRGAHGASVTDVMMPTVWCNTADTEGEDDATVVFRVDPTAPTADALQEAASKGCALWVSAEPKTTHVLDAGVSGRLTLAAAVRAGDRSVWSREVQASHTGRTIEYGQPMLRGPLPADVDPLALSFELQVQMQVACSEARGKGRMRAYFAGIARPRVHWTCPPGTEPPMVANR